MFFAMDPKDVKAEDGRGSVLKLEMGQNLIIVSWSEDGPEWRIPCWNEREFNTTYFIRQINGINVSHEGFRFFICLHPDKFECPNDVYYPILNQNVDNNPEIGYIRKPILEK